LLCNLSVELHANDSTRSTDVYSTGVMGSAALLSEIVWLLTEEFLNGNTSNQISNSRDTRTDGAVRGNMGQKARGREVLSQV